MNRNLHRLAHLVLILFLASMLTGLSRTTPLPTVTGDKPNASSSVGEEEVRFMRQAIEQINPSLMIEDKVCAETLPEAIHRYARDRDLDWKRLFVLAWQESDFDCHAKNRRDKGGAYGPFQIRRLWEPVTGDPRRRYFDPELAVERVVRVIEYYRGTPRFNELVARRYRNPMLCLYNTGESRRVNMRYCRSVGRKVKAVEKAWTAFRQNRT